MAPIALDARLLAPRAERQVIFMNENEIKTSAILVGIVTDRSDAEEVEKSIYELGQLLDTAGGEVFATVIQNKSTPDPRTLIGKGKVQEISELCANNGVKLVIFDEEPNRPRVIYRVDTYSWRG